MLNLVVSNVVVCDLDILSILVGNFLFFRVVTIDLEYYGSWSRTLQYFFVILYKVIARINFILLMLHYAYSDVSTDEMWCRKVLFTQMLNMTNEMLQ